MTGVTLTEKWAVERVKKERVAVKEKLRRMAKAYINGVFPDEEYHRQKRLIEMDLESPVCAKACPNRAIRKEEKYGAVLIDSEKCTGTRRCWMACPYGALQFAADGTGQTASKCNMSIDRLEEGLAPICV